MVSTCQSLSEPLGKLNVHSHANVFTWVLFASMVLSTALPIFPQEHYWFTNAIILSIHQRFDTSIVVKMELIGILVGILLCYFCQLHNCLFSPSEPPVTKFQFLFSVINFMALPIQFSISLKKPLGF